MQNAQQLHLDFERHVTDFVEKQRALIGLFELSLSSLALSAGERARLIAKQLALDKSRWKGGCVHENHRFPATHAEQVERVRDQFLAGAALTNQEDGHIERCDFDYFILQAPNRAAMADNLVEPVGFVAQA